MKGERYVFKTNDIKEINERSPQIKSPYGSRIRRWSLFMRRILGIGMSDAIHPQSDLSAAGGVIRENPLTRRMLKNERWRKRGHPYTKKIDDTPYEDEILVTNVIIMSGRTACRVMQDPYTGQIILIQNRFIDLIDKTAIEENEGEPSIAYYNKNLGIYWHNSTMKFRVMHCRNEKVEKIIKHLEQISLTE